MPLAVELHHEAPARCCFGKVKYRSLDRAQDALIRVCFRFRDGVYRDARPDRPMNVYRCGQCLCWHIGHQPKEIAA